MKCSVCEKLGLESTLRKSGGSWKTLAHYPSFTDEDRKIHHHDHNNISETYECSNKHLFRVVTDGKECWCGWNKNANKEIEIEILKGA